MAIIGTGSSVCYLDPKPIRVDIRIRTDRLEQTYAEWPIEIPGYRIVERYAHRVDPKTVDYCFLLQKWVPFGTEGYNPFW